MSSQVSAFGVYQIASERRLYIEIAGSDAARVANNLCTNDVAKLQEGRCSESFVTDIKGWTVAHVLVVKLPSRVIFLGLHRDPPRVAAHIDRYIIRDDAKVTDYSASQSMYVADGPGIVEFIQSLNSSYSLDDHRVVFAEDQAIPFVAVPAPIVSPSSILLACSSSDADAFLAVLEEAGGELGSGQEFERSRIAHFWPLQGADFDERTIPQELDRDARAISFTKGCYLGQETIARLDARGQLQKKLCLVKAAHASGFDVDAAIEAGEKVVGRLTSVWNDPKGGTSLGLALLRRGHFEPGTDLTCQGKALRVIARPD